MLLINSGQCSHVAEMSCPVLLQENEGLKLVSWLQATEPEGASKPGSGVSSTVQEEL